MLVLLDENLPHFLRLLIPGHDVRTVAFQGWKGINNGALLKRAEEFGFEVIVTADQSILYQQNVSQRRIAIITLGSNDREDVSNRIRLIVAAINAAKPGTFVTVDLNPENPAPPPAVPL